MIVDRSPEAAALLKAKGWRVLEDTGEALAVQIFSDADIAAINRCLLEHGLEVYRLERTQETLEDLFLRLVSNCEQEAVS